VPYEESVGALLELKDEGKIRHIGVSNVSRDQLRQAQRVTPIVSVQNRYNLNDRASESVLEACEEENLAFIPWAPLQVGEMPGEVEEIAKKHRVSTNQGAARVVASSLAGHDANPRHLEGRAPRR